MKLKDLIAVSGLPGLYKMAGSRSNGIVIEDLDTGKRKFVPSRKHQFSPLETISIFTMSDSEALIDVLRKMQVMKEDLPIVPAKSSNDELRAYFAQVMPEHDSDRVFPRDIQKIIKWYDFLDTRQLLHKLGDDEEE
jgi:hypothetical protein